MKRYRQSQYGKIKREKFYSSIKRKPKKKKKLIFKNRLFWLVILFLIILAGFFYLFFISPVFQIKDIEVYGNQKIETEQIKDMVRENINKKILVFIPRNFFSINLKEINQAISERFIYVEEAGLKKKMPDTIIINIKERTAFVCWCKIYSDEENKEVIEKCFYADKNGIVFEPCLFEENKNPIIKSDKNIAIGEKIAEEKFLESILEIYKKSEKELEIKIKEIFAGEREKDKLVARTEQGWEIYFNSRNNISDQLINLELILKEKISPEQRENLEYIDLRFGDRIFYREI